MHQKTKTLKKLIDGKSRLEINEICKDFYKGEKVFIFTCGPSLNDFDIEKFQQAFPNEAIFTVKQSFLKLDQCDFNFYNGGNQTPYDNDDTIFVFGRTQGPINKTHIIDPIDQREILSVSKRFDRWTFDNSIVRPWGPGIMYEQVLYHALHLGFSEAYICGWDLNDPKLYENHLPHYYDGIPIVRPCSPMYDGELEQVINASSDLYRFFSDEGLSIKLFGDKSYLSEEIPRVTLEGIIL